MEQLQTTLNGSQEIINHPHIDMAAVNSAFSIIIEGIRSIHELYEKVTELHYLNILSLRIFLLDSSHASELQRAVTEWGRRKLDLSIYLLK